MAENTMSGRRAVSRGVTAKEMESMNNIFHQTDETFFKTQYCHGFPSYAPQGAGTSRPASAIDGGERMKSLMENESKPLKELYRDRWHQEQKQQQQGKSNREEPVGGQKFLRTVDSLVDVKNLTHGTKSRVESNFSNIIFPGFNANAGTTNVRRTNSDDLADACRTMTHGRPTNSDRDGTCFWKIFNYETSTPSVKKCGNGAPLERNASKLQPKYDMITQEEEHQDTPAINKALQYLHKVRSVFSYSGAIQRTRDELERASRDGTGDYDWNALLQQQAGTEGTLDYVLLDPLLSVLKIDRNDRDGFGKFLDLLDSEVSLTQFELGKRLQLERSD